ncbi:MAG TPA: RNA methyltransferase [Gemmatimonas sp.]|nr:RNA methyltransferase [Gemmatimonas sp.]
MKLLTLARDLQRRKARHRQGLFVAEGVRTVESLLDSPLAVTGALVTTALRSDPRGAALFDRMMAREIPVQDVTDAELESASDTESPQGVLAIGKIPGRSIPVPSDHATPDAIASTATASVAPARYLVLDALQDPGNVGTIIRTAAAMGVTATIALPGTVDLWNAKVVRGTMGAIFSHPSLHATWEELHAFLIAHRIPCWTADTDGLVIDGATGLTLPPQLALVVGNEGAGISAVVAANAAERVAVAMAPGVESLNVAVATGILLHALRYTHSARPS